MNTFLDWVYIILALCYESHWIQVGILFGILEGYLHYRLGAYAKEE
jgi:hypothetical protein